MSELMTVAETADYFRTTPSALYNQRLRGETPGALGVRIGRYVLYRRSDLDRYLDEEIAAQLSPRY